MENQPESIPNENAILVDWFTVTFHDIQVSDVKRLLGLDAPDVDWDDVLSFQDGYPRQCSFANIVIRYGADKIENYTDDSKKTAAEKVRSDMGISLKMSGNGCRAFETYGHGNWIQLLQSICDLNTRVNITRLDLAFDDHTGVLDIWRIKSDVEERNYTGSPKKSKIVWSDDQKQDIQGLTVYIGSESSPVLIRIYDKAAERGFKGRHWIRVELQLRKERATAAVAEILKLQDVGTVFSGVLRNYCCFREPDSSDSNKSRWPIAEYWSNLINGVGRIRLWISPGEPYNFRKTEEHLVNQYGQALQVIDKIHGNIHELLLRSREAHPVLKKKYIDAINQAKLEAAMYREGMKKLRKQIGIDDKEPWSYVDDQVDIVDVFGDALLTD